MDSRLKPLSFIGKLPASKSMMNRALLIQSHYPNVDVIGQSSADDVVLMKSAVRSLAEHQPIDCGQAGTVLRFMALRAARIPGRHVLTGHSSLFRRPQDELVRITRQLGCMAQLSDNQLVIQSEGWRLQGDTLIVSSRESSQFLTSVLLNSWDLPFDLFVTTGAGAVSEGYWKMSVKMGERAGMKIDFWDQDFRVPRGQRVQAAEIETEIDLSSVFALAAIAAVNGQATFLEFPERSLQPDVAFVDILKTMGARIERGGSKLKVEKAPRLVGVAVNLRNCPDLFPSLAALAALAEGDSHLYGAPHLVHKESDRLNAMVELIRALGRSVVVNDDGMKISGDPQMPGSSPIPFDVRHDHRLVFAACVLRVAGHDIQINQPDVVSKSFPEFWQIVGWSA